MFDIVVGEHEIILSGRLDAAEAEKARRIFLSLEDAKVVDFGRLEYISSAGLGVLLAESSQFSLSIRRSLLLVIRGASFRTDQRPGDGSKNDEQQYHA